jgi:hypothetical protein
MLHDPIDWLLMIPLSSEVPSLRSRKKKVPGPEEADDSEEDGIEDIFDQRVQRQAQRFKQAKDEHSVDEPDPSGNRHSATPDDDDNQNGNQNLGDDQGGDHSGDDTDDPDKGRRQDKRPNRHSPPPSNVDRSGRRIPTPPLSNNRNAGTCSFNNLSESFIDECTDQVVPQKRARGGHQDGNGDDDRTHHRNNGQDDRHRKKGPSRKK